MPDSIIQPVRDAVRAFEGVEWSACGYPLPGANGGPPVDAGWVKFRVSASTIGWRSLEFLAWVCTDMRRAGERLELFPTANPPYLNTPGKVLAFVIECYPKDGDGEQRFLKVAEFINDCRVKYWPGCRPRIRRKRRAAEQAG